MIHGSLLDTSLRGLVSLLPVVAFSLSAATAMAAEFVVTTTTDGDPGSLRAAIIASNAAAGSDVILVSAGEHVLTIAGTNEDAAAEGDLDLTDIEGTLTIRGEGAHSTIVDGAMLDSVFDVRANVDVRFEALSITGANATFRGGGINIEGTASLIDCHLYGNSATWGGGIRVNGSSAFASVENCTFNDNTGSGGAIEVQQAGLYVSNSTISNSTLR